MSDIYFLVDDNDNIVNSIMWDGSGDDWQPPSGLRAIRGDGMWRDGWKWDGAKAYDPNPPPPEPDMPTTVSPPGMTVL